MKVEVGDTVLLLEDGRQMVVEGLREDRDSAICLYDEKDPIFKNRSFPIEKLLFVPHCKDIFSGRIGRPDDLSIEQQEELLHRLVNEIDELLICLENDEKNIEIFVEFLLSMNSQWGYNYFLVVGKIAEKNQDVFEKILSYQSSREFSFCKDGEKATWSEWFANIFDDLEGDSIDMLNCQARESILNPKLRRYPKLQQILQDESLEVKEQILKEIEKNS